MLKRGDLSWILKNTDVLKFKTMVQSMHGTAAESRKFPWNEKGTFTRFMLKYDQRLIT